MNMITLLALIGLVVLIITAILLTETENFGWATVALIASVVGAQCFHLVDFLTYASTHVVGTLLYVLGYLCVGVGWSFGKWFSFLLGFRDRFRDRKQAFVARVQKNDYKVLPPAIQYRNRKDADEKIAISLDPWSEITNAAFENFLHYETYRGNNILCKPRASKNKARIVAWMAFWPCSIIGTLLNDPVRRLFNLLFNAFKNLYQKMADYVFRNEGMLDDK